MRDELRKIPVHKILASRYQARTDFDPDALKELADSIEQNSLIQPITVRPVGSCFELVAGERRLRAVKLLGWFDIDAVVRTGISDLEAASAGLAENIQRATFTPIEEARGYQRMALEFGLHHSDIAKQVGKSRSYITNFIRLLELEPSVQQLLHDGVLTVAHARTIAALPCSHQPAIARLALRNAWSVRVLERKVADIRQRLEGGDTDTGKVGLHPDLLRLQNVLGEITGSPVRISFCALSREGSIEFGFTCLDEAQGLVDRIAGVDWEDAVG